MKRIVVVASFSGDARDFLRVDLKSDDRQAIILTPTKWTGFQGHNDRTIEIVWDIRRPGAYFGAVDNEVRRFRALYPSVEYRAVPW